MRERVERFVVLPFNIGCNSKSSVALGKSTCNNQAKKSSHEEQKSTRRRESKEEISSSSSLSLSTSSSGVVKKKNAFIGFLSLPKPNISRGIKRFFRRIKSFSQIFLYKEEEEEEDEPEREIEIGFPTDVKHVTHIGLDGSATTNPVKGMGMGIGMEWENQLNNPPEVLSFPTISLKQFELAMAAQSDHHDHHQPPLVVDFNHIVKENLKKAA